MEDKNLMYSKKVKIGALVLFSLLSLFLLIKTITEIKSWDTLEGVNAQNMISITGKGEVFAVPDIATFTFSVDEKGKTVGEAQKKATEKNNAAIKYLKDNGIAEKDIKTESYNANPEYDYTQVVCVKYPCPTSKPTLLGYEVSQTISVKVRNTDKAGDILSGIGATGVSNISGLSFTIDNDETLKADARTKAIADAKVKADKLAKDLGVKLGKVISFYEQADGGVPMYAMMDAKATGMGGGPVAATPDIQKGENKIMVSVTLTYRIK